MKVATKIFLTQVIAATFIFLFTYTALSKILDHSSFKAALEQSPVLSYTAAILAWVIPAAELIVSGLLFFPATRKKGLLGSLLLMSGFTLYIGAMLLFSNNLPCSCGGVLQQLTWQQHLLFNIFFTVWAAAALKLQKQGTRVAGSAVLG